MRVELYYFDGCPSYTQALKNLTRALVLEQLPGLVDLVPIDSVAEAQATRFIGSPTIRIDGIDIEGAEFEARGYAYGCRIYACAGGSAGWPSVELLRKALQRAKDV